MLSALGLSGTKKRWAPAKKLQKDGKMSKKQLIEYLEAAPIQIASAESVECVACLAKDKPDQSKFVELFNDWQCQLIENMGFEINFARMSLDEWKNTAGNAGHAKADPKVIEAFDDFERSIQATLQGSLQLFEIRLSLQLGVGGKDASEALMPRRAARAEKLQRVGPLSKSKLIRFCEIARDMVLSLETRELLGNLMSEYSTWKRDKLEDLINKVILNWQYELWETPDLAVEQGLGVVELSRYKALPGDTDIISAQKEMFCACQAIGSWFQIRPHKDCIPREDGRCYEPWSRADEAFKEERDGKLFVEGPMEIGQFITFLQKVIDIASSEEHGKLVEEVAFAKDPADLRAAERLMFELYEACGVEHRFATMLCIFHNTDQKVMQLTTDMAKAQQEIKTRMMAGLRKVQEAKKAAVESPSKQHAEGSEGYPAT